MGGTIEMGAGQGWPEHNARVSVGHRSFWDPAQPPPGGPSRVQGYMVSARQVHLPQYLCPAHASTLLSPAPSAPYGNDLLLPDLADKHGSPSASWLLCLMCYGLNGWFKSSVSLFLLQHLIKLSALTAIWTIHISL